MTKQDVPYRSGFVAVVGRPNVGKSTLINALIGKQIAIASSRPETTRKAIRGILTADHAQLVLVDTPGIHRPRTLLGQRLNDVVDESLADVDVVAFLLPADQEIGPGDKRILSRLRTDFATKREDGTFKWRDSADCHRHQDRPAGPPAAHRQAHRDQRVRRLLRHRARQRPGSTTISAEVPPACSSSNTPAGSDTMYPDDQVSEERPEDTIAELDPRRVPRRPWTTSCPIRWPSSWTPSNCPEDNETGQGIRRQGRRSCVSVYVERDSQKPIIIGTRRLEPLALRQEEAAHPGQPHRRPGKAKLDLHVKVAKGWQSDPKQLERLGF